MKKEAEKALNACLKIFFRAESLPVYFNFSFSEKFPTRKNFQVPNTTITGVRLTGQPGLAHAYPYA